MTDLVKQLVGALELAVRQGEHDMLLTGEELRQCNATLTAAKAGGWVAVQDCPDGDVWFALSCGHLVMGHKTGSMLAWDDEHSCCWSAEAIKAQPLTAPTLPKEQSA